jgi:hypothetical protein
MRRSVLQPKHVLIVMIWAAVPGIACAYIDPGNGAYMVQVLFTVVGAGLFYLRHPLRSIRAFSDWVSSRWRGHRPDEAALPESHREE